MKSKLQDFFDFVQSSSSSASSSSSNDNAPIAKRTRSSSSSSTSVSLPLIHPFVSASDLQNFCLDDHFCDYLDLFIAPPEPHPLQALFDQGIEFEQHIIHMIRERTGLPILRMASQQSSRFYQDQKKCRQDYLSTLIAMRRGDPILYNAYLWNEDEKLHGIPDLLVRNDALHMISNSLQNLPAKVSSFGNYYYVPIEIKHSTISRIYNKQYVSNSGRLRYYKTQLMMYARLLHHAQNVFPNKAFIIGKRVIDSDGSKHEGELHTLGQIDYFAKDSMYADIFDQAVDWMRRVKTEGRSWKIGAFPRELYPNLKTIHPYHQALKYEWADHIHDITQVWRCTSTHRDNARRWKIYSWDDPNCTAEKLGISQAYADTVNAILDINRCSPRVYAPSSLPPNVCEFGEPTDNMYVDFETINSGLNNEDDEERIFMIGVWYANNYTCFVMRHNTAAEELRIIQEFEQLWKQCNSPKCLYWYAEENFWKRALSRHDTHDHALIPWIDLYQPWIDQCIVIRGALNFKLKTLIRAMNTNGLIDVELPPDECSDGLQAMQQALDHYSLASPKPNVEEAFRSIIEYNRLDCLYVFELYKFISHLKSSSDD